jgi:hypothetical protein
VSALEPRVATFHGEHGKAPAQRSVLEDIEHPGADLVVSTSPAWPRHAQE